MSVIYQPSRKAREYAPLACNIYRGCDHRCTYCFAPSATYNPRTVFNVPTLRKNFILQLKKDTLKLWKSGTHVRILLCFTCDPYQKLDIEHKLTRQTIEILHGRQLNVQVLTKGGSRALRDIDLFTPNDAFASTLTWLDDERSLEWEPGAALPSDRIYALHQFYEKNIPTWVSLEPVLSPGVALQIIKEIHTFVNLFKIGKLNYHSLAETINWRDFGITAIELLESLNQPYYIKNDLLNLLPSEALGPCHITVAELERRFLVQSLRQPPAAPIAHTQQGFDTFVLL